MSTRSDDWQRGYEAQSMWLAGKTLRDAEIALQQREASQEPNEHNLGGTQATRDFIKAHTIRPGWSEIDPNYEDADDWRLDLVGLDTLEIGPTSDNTGRYSVVFVRRDPDNGETVSEETIGYRPSRDEAMDFAEQYKDSQYQPTERTP